MVAPRTPPLKRTSGPVERNGACSGKATSTSALPEPTIAAPQACLAAALVRDWTCPARQTGSPTASMPIVLSISISTLCSGGG